MVQYNVYSVTTQHLTPGSRRTRQAKRPCEMQRRTRKPAAAEILWLRTNGVSIDGAAAKVMNFDRLGKKVRPAGTFGNIEVG